MWRGQLLDSLNLRHEVSGIDLSSRESLAKSPGRRGTNEMQTRWAERPEHRPGLSVRDAGGCDEVLPVNGGNALFSVSL
jgi:hypothetical protein